MKEQTHLECQEQSNARSGNFGSLASPLVRLCAKKKRPPVCNIQLIFTLHGRLWVNGRPVSYFLPQRLGHHAGGTVVRQNCNPIFILLHSHMFFFLTLFFRFVLRSSCGSRSNSPAPVLRWDPESREQPPFFTICARGFRDGANWGNQPK